MSSLGDSDDFLLIPHSDIPLADAPVTTLTPHNTLLESGDWVGQVIWDSTLVTPDLVESDEDEAAEAAETAAKAARSSKPSNKLDPFNLSNDHIYEQSKESRHRIRQTFGAIEVFHSGPARALQLPFVSITTDPSGTS